MIERQLLIFGLPLKVRPRLNTDPNPLFELTFEQAVAMDEWNYNPPRSIRFAEEEYAYRKGHMDYNERLPIPEGWKAVARALRMQADGTLDDWHRGLLDDWRRRG